MKQITINIIELKDIYRFFTRFIDRILFSFSRPKYKIDSKINMGSWGKNLTIFAIERNWENCNWTYETNKSSFSFTEALVEFYNKRKRRRINYDYFR